MNKIREGIFRDFPGPYNLDYSNIASGVVAHYVVQNLWDVVEESLNLHDISVEGDESENSWIMGV